LGSREVGRKKATRATQETDMVESGTVAQLGRSPVMFDPYLTSSHLFVTAVSDNLAASYERDVPRKQKMRAADRETLKAVLRVIIANLAKASFEGRDPPQIGVPLRAAKQPRTRYDRPGFNGLQKILENITAMQVGFSLRKSNQKGIASALIADPWFNETLARFRFKAEHFELADGRETIWLSRNERDYVAGTVERELINYSETLETTRLRAEMKTINDALKAADACALAPEAGEKAPKVLTAFRELRRHFNSPDKTERFDLGGRLFGGWWETLPRSQHHLIRIDNEPVAELDFASMALRLAYLEAGKSPPDGDLYSGLPGLEAPRWRDGVKKVASSLLFRTTPMMRLPGDTKALLPPEASATSIRAALLQAHPALAGIFETGCGMSLMCRESNILINALLRLIAQGGPTALPLHDAILCPRSKAAIVEKAMGDAAEAVAGFRLPISLKSL